LVYFYTAYIQKTIHLLGFDLQEDLCSYMNVEIVCQET